MTYTKAFQEIKARADFAEISGQYLGNYSQMTGEVATTTMASRTSARPEAKEFVVNWFQEKYGVSLN
ncbi:hypothetical protein [Tateyamaria sp.]|uniref:hypothetical protein n=1 Tax=Tateyamaria sp. TaxID=1929288 RepID=UPI00329A811C